MTWAEEQEAHPLMGPLLSATPGTTEAQARWTAGAQAELTVTEILSKGMLLRGQGPGGLTRSGSCTCHACGT